MPHRTTLSLARAAQELTQVQLSERSGLSQAWISKAEAGSVEVPADRAAALASALCCSAELLQVPVHTLPIVHHRKRQSMPAKKLASLEAHLHLAGIVADPILEAAGIPAVDISFELTPFDGPEEAVDHFRQVTGLDDSLPVPSVVKLLESLGAVVVANNFGVSKIDALATRCLTGRTVVLLDKAAPMGRRRFTIAHEIGHIVMHRRPTEAPEDEADRFASELLMPVKHLRKPLEVENLKSFDLIANTWGVSIPAVVRRARDLGCITDRQYRSLNIDLQRFGQRIDVETADEMPSLLGNSIRLLLQDRPWSDVEQIARTTKAKLEEMAQ